MYGRERGGMIESRGSKGGGVKGRKIKVAYKADLEEGGWIIAKNDRKPPEDKAYLTSVTSEAWWIDGAERTSNI